MQSLLDLNRIFMAHFEKVVAAFSPKNGDHVVKSKVPGKKVYGAFLANLPLDVRERYDWELFRNNFHVFGNLSVVKANLGEGVMFHITPVAWPDPSELEEPFASAVVAARKLTLHDHSLGKHVNYDVPSCFGFFVDPIQHDLLSGLVKPVKLGNSLSGECIADNGITPMMSFNRLSCDELQLVIDTYVRLYSDFDEQQVGVFRKALNEKRLEKAVPRYLRWYTLAVEGKTFFKALCHVNPKKEAIKRTFFGLGEQAFMPEADPTARLSVYKEYCEELYNLIMRYGGAKALMMRTGDVSDIAFNAMHDVHHFTVRPNPDIRLKELLFLSNEVGGIESSGSIVYEEFRENAINGLYGRSSLTVTEVRHGQYASIDRQAIIVPLFSGNSGKILDGYKWPYKGHYRGKFELSSIARISDPYRALICRCQSHDLTELELNVTDEFKPYLREIKGLVDKLATWSHDHHTVFVLQPKCSFDVVANNIETGETSKFTVIV